MTINNKLWMGLGVGAVASVAIAFGPTSASGSGADSGVHEPGVYTVEDGKVDELTFRGYEAYARSCAACHGPDGVGSSFAPSLVRAAERRGYDEFSRTVAEGMEVQPGQVMPSFADDPYVMEHLGHIYSYLKARADGEVGRGRPQVIEEE
ncbi:cytochrome c [Aquisalimonas sp.]|uniref:c-type cytochrome n=1 Tax=unclassified Aquisalimonas TaxID=2644645 RepID=UPI0025BA45B1|nr:cytochrome c [Aquisalimonas sp.]